MLGLIVCDWVLKVLQLWSSTGTYRTYSDFTISSVLLLQLQKHKDEDLSSLVRVGNSREKWQHLMLVEPAVDNKAVTCSSLL